MWEVGNTRSNTGYLRISDDITLVLRTRCQNMISLENTLNACSMHVFHWENFGGKVLQQVGSEFEMDQWEGKMQGRIEVLNGWSMHIMGKSVFLRSKGG